MAPNGEAVESDSKSSGSDVSDMAESGASTTMPGNNATMPDEGVKIICVGLMRTGLKTLRKAMCEIGFDNDAFFDQEDIVSTYEQWDALLRNKADSQTFDSIFQGADVVMGMPTFCFWEQILERYPNARVILTVRDEDEWWQSVLKAKGMMDEDLPGAPLKYGSAMRHIEKFMMPSYHKFCEILRFAWATTLGAHALEGDELNEVATRSSYRRHNSYVKSTLSKRKTEYGQRQLLIYNVREGWDPLCKFLGKSAPEKEFPSVKNVSYFLGADQQQDVPAEEVDVGQEFEEMLVPDSEFGIKMRQEMRTGLLFTLVPLTAVAGAALAVSLFHFVELPVGVIALVYLAVMICGWQAYVVMHGLVMRVPALVVLPMAFKSLLIAACLQGCFITYGILKEMIVTKDKIASPVLIMSARLMSVICGAVVLLLTEGKISFGGAPLYAFSAFGFTNEASTWAGYEMLKYVSFPVQVMAKSCKLLPNMIMGKVLNGTKYDYSQYFQAIGAMVCVTIMHLTDEKEHKPKKGGNAVEEDEDSEMMKSLIGVSLLIMFFVTDSFTSQWQTSLYKKYTHISQTQMMLAGNLVGVCISMISIVTRWTSVSKSLNYAMENPEVMGRILMLGLSGALGQFCIYTAIKVLGPLAFTWIMTSRQLFSVLISLVWFGHGVSPTKLGCILTVFAIMSSKQLSRAVPQVMRQCSGCRARVGRMSEKGSSVTMPSKDAAAKPTNRRLMARGSQVWEAPESKKDD